MYQALVKANLQVRQSPGKDAQRVGGLKAGQVVNVYEEQDGWARINYNDQVSGWSSMQYLKPLKTAADDAATPDAPAASEAVCLYASKDDIAALLAMIEELKASDQEQKNQIDELKASIKAMQADVDVGE